MNFRKAFLIVYLRAVKALFNLKIGSVYPVRNAHYYLVSNFFKAWPIEAEDMIMFVHLHDSVISSRLLYHGSFERSETDFIKMKINNGDTVLDIGANIGYHTLTFAKLVGKGGRVFAFEPDPDNFALLKRNVDINGCKNVTLEQKAVSDTKGVLKLFLAEDNKGDHRTWDPHTGRRHVDIEAVTLDDYFKDYKGRIDFIKQDVEGAEGHVLRGAEKIIRKNTTLTGMTEFWPKGLRGAGTDPKEFLELLAGYGYKLYDIDAGNAEPSTIDSLLAKYVPEPDGQREVFTNIFFYK